MFSTKSNSVGPQVNGKHMGYSGTWLSVFSVNTLVSLFRVFKVFSQQPALLFLVVISIPLVMQELFPFFILIAFSYLGRN